MLAPMALARPSKALRFALLTTIASVLGGIFGYAIGYFAFDSIEPWLQASHYWEKYQLAKSGLMIGFLGSIYSGFFTDTL